MTRSGDRRQGKQFGFILTGFSLASLGGLQFLQGYFEIPWSDLWPLFLMVPGFAMVIGAVSNAEVRHRTNE